MTTVNLAALCSIKKFASPDYPQARNGLVFRFSNGQTFNGYVRPDLRLRDRFCEAAYAITVAGAHRHFLHVVASSHPLSGPASLHPLPQPANVPLARFNQYGRLLDTAANLRIVSVSGQTVRRGDHVIQFLDGSDVHSRPPVPMG